MKDKIKLAPRDASPPGGGPAPHAPRRWLPLAYAALAGAVLVIAALIPAVRGDEGERRGVDIVEQWPGERSVSSVRDVLALYRLDANLESYLSVDEDGRIIFEADAPIAEGEGAGEARAEAKADD